MRRFRLPGIKQLFDEAVAPTCEESGKTEGSHCSVCNEVLKEQEDVPPAGPHSGKRRSDRGDL